MSNRASKKFLTWFVLIIITIALVYWLASFVTRSKANLEDIRTERELLEEEQRGWYEDVEE